MTQAETAKLLALVQSFDHRDVGEAEVYAWHSALGDLPLDECIRAVKGHYAEDTRWIMPGHVRARVTATRRQVAEAAHTATVKAMITAAKPTPDAYRAGAARLRAAWDLARGLDPDNAAERRRVAASVLAVRCPWCHAASGQPCRNTASDRPLSGVHPSRRSAAALAVAS